MLREKILGALKPLSQALDDLEATVEGEDLEQLHAVEQSIVSTLRGATRTLVKTLNWLLQHNERLRNAQQDPGTQH